MIILELILAICGITTAVSCGGKTKVHDTGNQASQANNTGNQNDLHAVSTGVNQFSANLYKITAEKNTKDNLVLSPLSVDLVLAMLSSGASGITDTQMRSILHLPSDKRVTENGFQSLIDTLNNVKKVILTLANKIFVNNGFEIENEFKKSTTNYYRSEIQSLDFSDSVAASQTINDWSAAKTNNLIKNVISPESVKNAVMILINAVYFKGNWKTKFDSNITIPQKFYTTSDNSTNVLMMQKTSHFNYGEIPEVDAKFVELLYESTDDNDSTSMIVIVPNNIEGLQKIDSNLNITIEDIRKRASPLLVRLSLPKFKIENRIDLSSNLIEMGLGNIFGDNANFSGITKTKQLRVTEIYQKGYIVVNEEGSEAAAVTVVGVRALAMIQPPEPVEFNVNRPFLYAIIHRSTNTILFQGHVTLPTY